MSVAKGFLCDVVVIGTAQSWDRGRVGAHIPYDIRSVRTLAARGPTSRFVQDPIIRKLSAVKRARAWGFGHLSVLIYVMLSNRKDIAFLGYV